jgi:hypothetical protein
MRFTRHSAVGLAHTTALRHAAAHALAISGLVVVILVLREGEAANTGQRHRNDSERGEQTLRVNSCSPLSRFYQAPVSILLEINARQWRHNNGRQVAVPWLFSVALTHR